MWFQEAAVQNIPTVTQASGDPSHLACPLEPENKFLWKQTLATPFNNVLQQPSPVLWFCSFAVFPCLTKLLSKVKPEILIACSMHSRECILSCTCSKIRICWMDNQTYRCVLWTNKVLRILNFYFQAIRTSSRTLQLKVRRCWVSLISCETDTMSALLSWFSTQLLHTRVMVLSKELLAPAFILWAPILGSWVASLAILFICHIYQDPCWTLRPKG